MGFKQPAQLPDFQKLKIILTSQGVQKWNPAAYDVMNRLIESAQQSQDVIVNVSIPEAAFDGIYVGEALEGDGLPEFPLNVKYDGTTIALNGSNQLTAADGAGIFYTSGTITANQIDTLGSTHVQILAGIANKIIVPINGYYAWSQQDGAFVAAITGAFFYNGLTAPVVDLGGLNTVSSPGPFTRKNFAPSATAVAIGVGTASPVDVIGKAIEIGRSGSTANTTHSGGTVYAGYYKMAYRIFTP